VALGGFLRYYFATQTDLEDQDMQLRISWDLLSEVATEARSHVPHSSKSQERARSLTGLSPSKQLGGDRSWAHGSAPNLAHSKR
jgi:hypothetical protein